MRQIQISTVSGQTPIAVYVSDYSGNNKIFLDFIYGPTSLPISSSLINTMSEIMLTMSASNNCETFQILPCTPQPSITPSTTPTPTPT